MKQTPDTSRRRLLRGLVGATTAGALAGCTAFETDLSSEDGPDPGDEPDDPEPGGKAGGDEPGGETNEGACPYGERDPGPDCDGPVELSAAVTSDTVLGDECTHYRVPTDLFVTDGATLTVLPGTTLSFESGASLQIRNGASLSAEGTCRDPIRFTGEQPTRGYWEGLIFRHTDSLDNRLRHVIVEHAGGERHDHTVRNAGIVLMDSRASLEHCTMRENEGEGIYLRYDAVLDAFERCLVTENDTAAAARGPAVHFLSDTSTYVGNDDDRILVHPTADGLEAGLEAEWAVADARYVVSDTLHNRGALTVGPGATVSFAQDAGIVTRNGGTLTAVGLTPEERREEITFTGEQPTRGFWQGLEFRDTDRVENQLRHAVVEYAGSAAYNHATVPANVTVRAGSRLAVTDTVLRESEGYGICLGLEETLDSFHGNEVTRNGAGAAWARCPSAHYFSDTSTYVGNDDDRLVVVSGGDDVAEGTSVTWEGVDARYVVTDLLYVQGDLEIEPGATIGFEQDAGLEVRPTGSLSAVGLTPEERREPITFTGEQPTRGYWRGLSYRGTDRVTNRLQHVVVEYGGSKAFNHRTEPANVTAWVGSRLDLVDATVRDSAGYGLFEHDSEVTTANVDFSNNDRGPRGQA